MTISLLLYPFCVNNTFKLPEVLYYDGQNHHFDVIIPEKYELADAILPVDRGFLHVPFARPLRTSILGLTLNFARPLMRCQGLTITHVHYRPRMISYSLHGKQTRPIAQLGRLAR